MSEQSESERLDAEAQRRGKEWQRYEEMKRLAEMAFAAIVANPRCEPSAASQLGEGAWEIAEVMYAASERRRPQE
jgi:hypothetical protein